MLIRNERRKKCLTEVELAQLTNYSRSYIFTIERGGKATDEIYAHILNTMGIKFIGEKGCKKYGELIEDSIYDIIYLRCTKESIKRVLSEVEPYKTSCIYDRYMILKLMYSVVFIKENSKEKVEFIKEIVKIYDLFSSQDQQIINDYLGVDEMSRDAKLEEQYYLKALELEPIKIQQAWCTIIYQCLKSEEMICVEHCTIV